FQFGSSPAWCRLHDCEGLYQFFPATGKYVWIFMARIVLRGLPAHRGHQLRAGATVAYEPDSHVAGLDRILYLSDSSVVYSIRPAAPGALLVIPIHVSRRRVLGRRVSSGACEPIM